MDICARGEVDAFAKNNGFHNVYEQLNDADGEFMQFSYFFETEDHTKSLYTIAKFICEHFLNGDQHLAVVSNMKVWVSQRDEF